MNKQQFRRLRPMQVVGRICGGLRSGLLGTMLLATAAGVSAHQADIEVRLPAGPAEQTLWGVVAEANQVDREVLIRMDDQMRFYPDHLQVEKGETLRLLVRNEGKIMHELVLGTAQELAEHAQMMELFPGMEYDEPWMVHVPPGQQQSLVWTFNRAGRFEFGCLLPGHYQAGMRGQVQVRPASHH